MAWDAYALRPEIDPKAPGHQFLNPDQEQAFRQAGAVPWLDGFCKGLLHRATGIPDYDERTKDKTLLWSPQTVQRAQTLADWEIPLQAPHQKEPHDRARLFLDVCAALNLAIWFVW